MNKGATLGRILAERVSAIIRTQDEGLARDAMNAAVAGGIRVVEFTLTTPGAYKLIAEFAARGELLVGAGTVMTTEEVRRSMDAGAQFIVSPIFDAEVMDEANRRGAVTIPGTFTATEMMTAHRAGADLLKLFPAPGDVAEYVRAILGPMPELRIFPTSGVTVENFTRILDAGAVGVGMTRGLFDLRVMAARGSAARNLAARDLGEIESRAREIMKRLEKYAGQSVA